MVFDELQENLKEVLELCLEEMEPENKQYLPQFEYEECMMKL